MDMPHVNPKKMETLGDGRVRLRGAGTRKGVLVGVGLLLVAAFWNSITWVFVFAMWSEEGALKWGGLAFIGIFVLIGLGLLVGGVWVIVRAVLVGGRISPPVLTIDRLPLRLGEKFKVSYEQQTRKQCEINKVTVTLVCKEWVRYTVGTDTRTAEHTVCEHEEILAENIQTLGAAPINGEAEFAVPPEAMQSFDAMSNKITWSLKVHTDIAHWPDYTDSIAIAVGPRIAEERS